MSTTDCMQDAVSENRIQLVTARCGDLLVGLNLTAVQEINRLDSIILVPEVPPEVRGVINLRGDVITMIDLGTALDQPPREETIRSHNVFVRDSGEVIGLVTDGVSDILTVSSDDIDSTPANLRGADSAFFSGVYQTPDGELVMILDLPQLLEQSVTPPAGTCSGE